MYDGGGSVYLYSYSMYRSGVLLRSRSVRWRLVLDRLYTRLAAGSSTKEQCLKSVQNKDNVLSVNIQKSILL